MGFTPRDASLTAREQCRSAVNAQFGNGYVIEYVTLNFGDPNPGFESDPVYLSEKETHRKAAGKFVAVHRLRSSPRPLRDILGDREFERLQDIWASNGKRYRWTVAFPIIESYAILEPPRANAVLAPESMRRLFGHPSGTLRPLNDAERSQITELHIEPRFTTNAWIGIEDEAKMADLSPLNPTIVRMINQDIAVGALEGLSEEQKVMVRKRAAWLAQRFTLQRAQAGELTCDNCGFDPRPLVANTGLRPRSLLDVHHMNPLDEGQRRTNEADLCLVCPNCHRFMHRLAATLSDQTEKAKALRPASKAF